MTLPEFTSVFFLAFTGSCMTLFTFGYWLGFRAGSAPIRRARHKRLSSIPKLLADRQPKFIKTPQELSIEAKRRALGEQISRL